MVTLVERLLYEEEGTTLDFKEEQYAFIGKKDYQKSELLKDILAFANAWRREDSYILIGVKEVKGGKSIILGIDEKDTLDDASLQEFVNKKINKPISFEYKNVSIDGKMIGVIKIPLENNQRPFFLKNDYGKLKKYEVKIRRGSSTDSADPDEIFKMSQNTIIASGNPVLKLEFANNVNKQSLGKSLKLESEYWDISDVDNIPDYVESHQFNQFDFQRAITNSNYYRQVVRYYIYEKLYKSISFSLYNDSNILSTDIKIEIKLEGNVVNILKKKDLPEYPKTSFDPLHDTNINRINKRVIQPDILLEKRDDIWYIDLLFKKIQAKQTIYSSDIIYLAAKDEVILDYKIYADNLSEPIIDSLNIEHKVILKNMSYRKILDYDDEIQEKEFEIMMKKREK